MTMTEDDLIELDADELAQLIRASKGRTVHTTYPGGALILTAATRWALPILARLRGIEISPALDTELSTQ